jgi:hypothetical protein
LLIVLWILIVGPFLLQKFCISRST